MDTNTTPNPPPPSIAKLVLISLSQVRFLLSPVGIIENAPSPTSLVVPNMVRLPLTIQVRLLKINVVFVSIRTSPLISMDFELANVIVSVYPVVSNVNPYASTFTVQAGDRASKYTFSDAVGIAAPPGPPDHHDQLSEWPQLLLASPTK